MGAILPKRLARDLIAISSSSRMPPMNLAPPENYLPGVIGRAARVGLKRSQPSHARALRNMRNHGEASGLSSISQRGAHDICSVRAVRSG